jgi:DNA-binding HxlR family transcriptional regulator
MTKPLPKTFNCPTEFALTVLGGKWKTIILAYLSERPCHYSELRQLLSGLSDKVLTERLKDRNHLANPPSRVVLLSGS